MLVIGIKFNIIKVMRPNITLKFSNENLHYLQVHKEPQICSLIKCQVAISFPQSAQAWQQAQVVTE